MARDAGRIFADESVGLNPKSSAELIEEELISDSETVLNEGPRRVDSDDEFFGEIFLAGVEDAQQIDSLLVGRVDMNRFSHECSAKKGIVTLRWKDGQILRWSGGYLVRMRFFFGVFVLY